MAASCAIRSSTPVALLRLAIARAYPRPPPRPLARDCRTKWVLDGCGVGAVAAEPLQCLRGSCAGFVRLCGWSSKLLRCGVLGRFWCDAGFGLLHDRVARRVGRAALWRPAAHQAMGVVGGGVARVGADVLRWHCWRFGLLAGWAPGRRLQGKATTGHRRPVMPRVARRFVGRRPIYPAPCCGASLRGVRARDRRGS